MRVITKRNFLVILCISYTIISVLNIVYELCFKSIVEWSQINNLHIFFISGLAIFSLSQQYRLEKLPLLIIIIIQYACFMSLIMGYLWLSSHYIELHPNGYRDMWLSCTVGYIIGLIVYYVSIFYRVRKQNDMLKRIKEKRKQSKM